MVPTDSGLYPPRRLWERCSRTPPEARPSRRPRISGEHLALVVIQDLAAWLREHRLLLRLEDAPLRVDEGDAFTFEDDAGLQLGPSQVVVYLAQPSNMVEGVLGGSGCRGLLDPYRHQLRQIDSDKRRAHFKVS